jgi:lipopolysaccharide/colanic/teichoic acid biosynthesis glycosyltransferase
LNRAFDLIVVCVVIPVILPLSAVIALSIKATSSGPLFFRQNRVGKQKKLFRIYKFRTMVDRAEDMGTSVTTRDDPRITPLGKILRRMKLDELPQLINVLKGDMSLVGPRPDVPEIVRNYTPDMKEIIKIRPGITSEATLHLSDEEDILARVDDPDTFYDVVLVPLKIKLAMGHVERNSFTYDLRVLSKTVWMLTLGRWWPIEEHPEVTQLRDNLEMGIYSPGNRDEKANS